MLYPKKMSSKKADLIIGISIIISILIGIMLFVINKLTSGTIQWAALANSAAWHGRESPPIPWQPGQMCPRRIWKASC